MHEYDTDIDIRKPHGLRIESSPTPLSAGRQGYLHIKIYRWYKHDDRWNKAGPVVIPVRHLVWTIEAVVGLKETIEATALPETLPRRFEIEPYRDIHESSNLGVKCTVKRKSDGTPYFWAHLYNNTEEDEPRTALSLFEGHLPHLIEGLLEASELIDSRNAALELNAPKPRDVNVTESGYTISRRLKGGGAAGASAAATRQLRKNKRWA